MGSAMIIGASSLTGCVVADDDGQFISLSQGVENGNKMALNGLTLNRIALSTLAASPLAVAGGSTTVLKVNTTSGLHLSALGRQVLEYTAQCALNDDQVLVVPHDGIEDEYPGLLGLAPGWATAALTTAKKREVSACMLAHVNAYGVEVMLSVRRYGAIVADEEEVEAFPVFEGVFFGQVYQSTQKMYACQGDDPAVAMAQSPDRALRVCTDSTPDCAMVSLGRCRDVCETRNSKYGWTDCWAAGVMYTETVSVYLRADDPGDTQTCAWGESCDLGTCEGPDCTGHFDGASATLCAGEATGDSTASFDCSAAGTCDASCEGSTCAVDCLDAETCGVSCTAGSDCEIDCLDADDCGAVVCAGGSSCILDCTDATTCGFATCDGVEQTCPGDVVVCNRACP